MIRSVPATDLAPGMVLALPMGRTATVREDVKVGTKYVTFRTEHGKTRVGRYEEVTIEEIPKKS